jgi:hypothetical protein
VWTLPEEPQLTGGWQPVQRGVVVPGMFAVAPWLAVDDAAWAAE